MYKKTAFNPVFYYIIVPIIAIVIYGYATINCNVWVLELEVPPTIGYSEVFVISEKSFYKAKISEITETYNRNFLYKYLINPGSKLDIRLFIPSNKNLEMIVKGRFISADKASVIQIPETTIATNQPSFPSSDCSDNASKFKLLPQLSSIPFDLDQASMMAYMPLIVWLLVILLITVFMDLLLDLKYRHSRFLFWCHVSNITKFLRKKFLFWAVLINVTFASCLYFFLTVRYQTADDPAMAMIANGTLSGHPSEHLVFANIIAGYGLKWLYLHIGIINWYTVLLYAALIVSASVIMMTGIIKKGFIKGLAFYGISCVFFLTYFYTELQFTLASSLCVLAGVSLLAVKSTRRQIIPARLFLSFVLIIIGTLIRFESAAMMLVFMAPALFYDWIQTGKWSSILCFLFAGGTVFIFHRVNTFSYCINPNWADYYHYNVARGALHQTPRIYNYAFNKKVYDEIGWSQNDQRLFQGWLYQDPNIFSIKNIQKLDRNLRLPSDEDNVLWSTVRPLIIFAWMPLIVVIFLLRARCLGYLCYYRTFLILISFLGIIYYLGYTARVPGRVFAPLCFSAFWMTILLENRPRYGAAVAHCYRLLFLFLFYCAITLCGIYYANTSSRNEQRTGLLELCTKRLGAVKSTAILAPTSAIRYEDFPPFSNYEQIKRMSIIDVMWTYPSPDLEASLARNSISNPLYDLVNVKDYYLLIPTFSTMNPVYLKEYFREHYRLTVDYEVVNDAELKPINYPNFSLLHFYIVH